MDSRLHTPDRVGLEDAVSQVLIQRYLNDLADLRRVGGTNRETVVREAFKTLLKSWGEVSRSYFHSRVRISNSGQRAPIHRWRAS